MDFYATCILGLSLSLLFFVFRKKRFAPNLPPGRKGWPVLGETLRFMAAGKSGCPENFVNDRTTRHSPDVFRTNLYGEDMTVFCGASGNKFLFSGEGKYVTSWWPNSIKKITHFPENLGRLSNTDAKKRRSFLLEFLKPEELQRYIPVMDSMTRDHLATDWSPNKEVRVFPLSKRYTFALACRLFMNIRDPEIASKFASSFARVTPGLIAVPINIPGTPFNRAMEGGKAMRQELLKIIRQRKMEISEGKDASARDLFTRALLEGDDDGTIFYEMDASSKILGLLIASHETTSTSITAIVNYLAQYPHIYDRFRQEQMEIAKSKGPTELLNWDDVQKMKYSWNVACESMRLLPPAPGAYREATKDFTFAGYTIPKGWKTFWTVHSTHKNPKYFPDPEKFDPSRFEGNGPAPFTFVPFGGGPRMCPGKEYARLEILVFMHNLVTKFKLEKAIPDEKFIYNPSPVPVEGLRLRLQPHN
ncbi:beta-amyrin 28-monooxygenase-like [Rhodamnia argentea]|uniref:Beta-amyrin 28-monooxygenase-like n=1 Tax=Rhodamnia argentea TaxID=178133 RepID=A0ABM3H669_9MYRT|nr:beta-amyrin 28-monooxygenase-like [Rhodamnia argentea]